jgi:CMP-N-acetylneuraminic acid synthetase
VKLFIPIKEQSVRVPNKNFRQFGDVPLYKRCLLRFKLFEIWVDTDSDKLEKLITEDPELSHVNIIRRKPELIGNDVSVNLLIENFINNYCKPQDVICQIHVTSPFLEDSSIMRAKWDLESGFDSICSATEHQSRFWMSCGDNSKMSYIPLNHNPLKLEKTQDLPTIYEENSAFYMFKAESFTSTRNRIGVNHHFQTISFPETVDIDTEEDFKFALNCLNS